MDDSWAAIIVSAVTGGFGLLGILITQNAAKLKARKIVPNAMDIIGASEGIQNLPRLDYLAAMKQDIQQFTQSERDAHHDIKEMIRELKYEVRDGVKDIRHDITRLER